MEKISKNEQNSIELNILDSTDYSPINKDLELKNDKKEFLIEEDNEEKNDSIINKRKNKNTLYGNNITIKAPKHIGKMKVLFYYKDNPLIVIGPDCKLLIL